jgi:hypothetical protein
MDDAGWEQIDASGLVIAQQQFLRGPIGFGIRPAVVQGHHQDAGGDIRPLTLSAVAMPGLHDPGIDQ